MCISSFNLELSSFCTCPSLDLSLSRNHPSRRTPSPSIPSILSAGPVRRNGEWPLLTHHGRLLSPTGFSSRFRNDNRDATRPEGVARCHAGTSGPMCVIFFISPRGHATPRRAGFTYGVSQLAYGVGWTEKEKEEEKKRRKEGREGSDTKSAGRKERERERTWLALRVISRPLMPWWPFLPGRIRAGPRLVTSLLASMNIAR